MGWLYVFLFWIAFAGTHIVLTSAAVRPRIVAPLQNRFQPAAG